MRDLFFLMLIAVLLPGLFVLASCDDDDDDNDDSASDDDDDDNNDDDDDDDTVSVMWQDPPSNTWMSWNSAVTYCDDLDVDGYDDWRLPTVDELRSLIQGCDATATGGACNVTADCLEASCKNDACTGCEFYEGPGMDGAYWSTEMTGEINWYWSSSLVADNNNEAWFVSYMNALVSKHTLENYPSIVRCIRP